jgi:tRNA(Ser,Leu) C12 N-acetylase TAN1
MLDKCGYSARLNWQDSGNELSKEHDMHDWNIVVTIHQGHFQQAIRFLESFGDTGKTDYFNVLVMKVDDSEQFLEDVSNEIQAAATPGNIISRIMPASVTFDFQVPAEFESQLQQTVEPWLRQLAGGRFYVRMHRRGFKGRLSSQDEERFLDHYLMDRLAVQDAMGSIDFEDPDYIIDIETVGQRAGVSLWSREQRKRYALLKLD